MIQGVVRQSVIEDAKAPGLFHLEAPPALIGISERYLSNAEQDFERFVNFDHPYWAVKKIIDERNIPMDGAVVIDVASGFGNTVIPLLRDFRGCRVVASDLSESILRILLREAGKKGLGDRVQAVVCDGQDTTLWSPGTADLVVGGAALHHMIDPSLTISSALSALKPGGTAIFLEPMEVGHAIMRLALDEVLRMPMMHEIAEYKLAAEHFGTLTRDIDARTHHCKQGNYDPWESLDDKWVFPRSYLEAIADKHDCKVSIHPLDLGTTPFTTKVVQSLEIYGGLKASVNLPPQAIEILTRYDAAFSAGGHADIPIEAAVTFTRVVMPSPSKRTPRIANVQRPLDNLRSIFRQIGERRKARRPLI